jgi:hypothetical protein
MSKRVIFTCTLLLLLGVAGCLDTASSFTRGEINFNISALFFPVALALFLALPGARIVATVVFSFFYLVLALLLVVPGQSISLQLLGVNSPLQMTFPIILVFVAMFGSVLALLHWTLFSQPFEAHLDP